MAETLALLLLAHVLADFVFQTNRMAQAKAEGHGAWIAAHGAVVLVSSLVMLAPVTVQGWLVLTGLTAAHLGIDLVKIRLARRLQGVAAFLADQVAHLVTLVLVAGIWPLLWAEGLWGSLGPAWWPSVAALLAGAILATRAGSFVLGLLMQPWGDIGLGGLPGGGRIIGLLERGIIFVLILAGEPGGIGFLIAAKSVLRFGTVKEEARLSEYVIIGTLASFGWATLIALATVMLLSALPPLGIPDLSP